MADIEEVYIQTYETNVRHLAQQGITRIRPWVQEVAEQSETHNWETLDEFDTDTTVNTKSTGGVTTRLQDTPDTRGDWQRRRTLVDTFDHGTSSEQEDIVQSLVDPNSNLVMAQAKAMKRKVDDVIIEGAFGPALLKDGSTIAFPASQVVGDGTAPFDFDLVTAVYEKFMENDIEPEMEKVMVIGPTQLRKLQQTVQATNVDYVNVKALAQNGYVNNWMGFTWIVSTRLTDGGTPGQIECIAMTRKALGLHVARDISAKVAEDPSKSFAWRMYCYMTMDCVRVEDKHIVKFLLADTL